jgi:hypothetical protein
MNAPALDFLVLLLSWQFLFLGFAAAFLPESIGRQHNIVLGLSQTRLMSLKPAAQPLMDSGKALARSGELLIDLTATIELYGGGLSSAGAQIRNSGDCVAQAGASCRFKTAAELVCDELREGATCLTEACDKLKLAVEEANSDKDDILSERIEAMVEPISICGSTLEASGEAILKNQPVKDVGEKLVECGEHLQALSTMIQDLAPSTQEAKNASQRMSYASERMIQAGNELRGTPKPKAKGKAWLKG